MRVKTGHRARPISTNLWMATARSALRLRFRDAIAAFALLLCAWGPALAKVPDRFANAGTNEIDVQQFLGELQAAVTRDDWQAVVDLFSCPCSVWDGRCSLRLMRAADALARYDAVFTTDLRNIFAQGLMAGEGRLWFTPSSTERLAITAINAPARTPPARRP